MKRLTSKEMSYAYFKAKKYIEKWAKQKSDDKSKTSNFWQDIFDKRSNFPLLHEMYSFRSPLYSFGLGTGGDLSEDEERSRFNRFVQMVLEYIDENYLLSFDEEVFGGAKLHEYKGRYYSTSFLMNTGTSYVVNKHIAEHCSEQKLKILEIGPGWGGVAYQLMQKNDISNYVLCDLPNNLFLSSFYLQLLCPEMHHEFIEDQPVELMPNTIYYVLPDFIENVQDQLDLVINSFSLQEMDKASAQSYVTWASKQIKDDGIFISINAHGKSGIQIPEEYGFDQFDIKDFNVFRKTPAGIYNSIPYELVLGKKVSVGNEKSEYDNLYVLCRLMQLGFDSSISSYRECVVHNKINVDSKFLKDVSEFFIETEFSKKEAILKRDTALLDNEIAVSLLFLLYFSVGRLDDCLSLHKDVNLKGEQEFVKTFLAMILFHLGKWDSEKFEKFIECNSPSLKQSIIEEINAGKPNYLREVLSVRLNLKSEKSSKVANTSRLEQVKRRFFGIKQ